MNPSANHTATPAGIIGMPGWFASEQVAGFDRNRWLVSSEYAPRPKFTGDGPPLGAVLVAPEDGLDRLPKIVVRYLAVWPDFVDQRLQLRPQCVAQNVNTWVLRHPPQIGMYLRS